MASETEIANMALAHLNAGSIASRTEQSASARAVGVFYDIARDKVLEDSNWPFARKFVTLGLVEEDPEGIDDEWSFSYRYPSDCLKVRRIISSVKPETRETEIKYMIGRDDTATLIYTDQEDARIEYTKREDDPGRYPATFTLALSYYLASLIAVKITAGDPFSLGKKAEANYIECVSRAFANSFNEQHLPIEPESTFIQARG